MKIRLSRKTLLSHWVLLIILAAGWQAARADDLPESAYISGVYGHPQSYSLSCEARAAVDWAAYWGVSISETEFLFRLPGSDNPDLGFVGSANDPWGNIPPLGYGVHAEPVADLLREYGLEAEARRGLSWDDLRAEIAAGRPVIVWVIGQMWGGTPYQYTDVHGKTTTVAYFEHTMILIGYNSSAVQVVDVYSGAAQTYKLSSFLASWAVLDQMAVTGQLAESVGDESTAEEVVAAPTPVPSVQISHLPRRYYFPFVGISWPTPVPAPEVAVEPSSDETRSYIVRSGDFLIALAERFGVDWRTLAALNQIEYPFVIFPGQTLVLP